MTAIEPFDAVDLIKIKRDGGVLSTAQIQWLVDAYTRGYVADEQMSAMTMAIFLRGMVSTEINDLTAAMVNSGERLDFSGLSKITTDKHSTGGVGDKITLPLAPLVASLGSRFRNCQVADSVTRAEHWTSSRAFPGGVRISRMPRCWRN